MDPHFVRNRCVLRWPFSIAPWRSLRGGITMPDLITLKEQRAEKVRQARTILDQAERGGGGVIPDAKRRFDTLMAEARALKDQEESERELGDTETELGRTPRALRGAADPDHAGRDDDPTEVRALRPDETVRQYLEKRGELRTPEAFRRISLGRYLRSMVLGPENEAERRALLGGSDSQGGYTVPTVLAADLIQLLRAKTRVMQAGARTVMLTTAEHGFARLTSDPVAAWRFENVKVAESEPTFGRVAFRPRSLACLVKISRELWEDSVNLAEALPRVLSAAMAVELDRAALVGQGAAAEPLGVLNDTDVPPYIMGTDGAAITDYVPFVTAVELVLMSNGDAPTVAIAHPRTLGAIDLLVDSTGQPLQRPPSLQDFRFLDSTNLPIDQTQGVAENASSVILGGFPHLWVGIRSEVRVEVLKEVFAENLQYGLIAHLRADVLVEQPGQFAKIIGIIPA